jgi:hypothetical protein
MSPNAKHLTVGTPITVLFILGSFALKFFNFIVLIGEVLNFE